MMGLTTLLLPKTPTYHLQFKVSQVTTLSKEVCVFVDFF